jgi:UDP-GlcNAc3NAcA epimerase
MPEELNRIICDHCSTVLFAPTDTALNNLAREGFNLQTSGPFSINHPAVVKSGDVMYDNTLFFKQQAVSHSEIIHTLKLNSKFALCTIHRPINTDNPDRLLNIFSTISEIAIDEHLHFVLPVHPRTDKILKENPVGETIRKKIQNNSFIHLIEPRSF